MKKIILTFLFTLISVVVFAQPQMSPRHFSSIDFSKYEVVDSLPLERILIHFNKEIDDNENLISLGGGDYMAIAPHKDKIVIKTTNDRSKAIILYNSYVFGRHFEFNIEENERRIVFWYDDKGIYCGYIYDKEFKICKYFESRKEYKRFMRKPFFNVNNWKL